MLTAPDRHHRVPLPVSPVRHRLLRRQAGRSRTEHHRQSVHLRAVDRRLLHVLDVLRQRRRAASSRRRFPADLYRPDADLHLGWYLIRKIIRISKVNRITSIADFIASRYGKSSNLGGLVTIIAVVEILPYISLQLKRSP